MGSRRPAPLPGWPTGSCVTLTLSGDGFPGGVTQPRNGGKGARMCTHIANLRVPVLLLLLSSEPTAPQGQRPPVHRDPKGGTAGRKRLAHAHAFWSAWEGSRGSLTPALRRPVKDTERHRMTSRAHLQGFWALAGAHSPRTRRTARSWIPRGPMSALHPRAEGAVPAADRCFIICSLFAQQVQITFVCPLGHWPCGPFVRKRG